MPRHFVTPPEWHWYIVWYFFLGGIASGAVVVDGTVLVGGGVGVRGSNPASVSDIASRQPADLVALCVPGAPSCPTPGT